LYFRVYVLSDMWPFYVTQITAKAYIMKVYEPSPAKFISMSMSVREHPEHKIVARPSVS